MRREIKRGQIKRPVAAEDERSEQNGRGHRRKPQILKSPAAAVEVGDVYRPRQMPILSSALSEKIEEMAREADRKGNGIGSLTIPVMDEVAKFRSNSKKVGLIIDKEMSASGTFKDFTTFKQITGDIYYRFPEYPIISPASMTHEFARRQDEVETESFYRTILHGGITRLIRTPGWQDLPLAKYLGTEALEGLRGSSRVTVHDLNHDIGLRKMLAEARRMPD